MKSNITPKLFRRADILCILLALALAISFLFLFKVIFPHSEKAIVKIVTDVQTEYYPLDTDKTIELISNQISITVKIQNGKAWIEHSTCPDGICRSMGKISENGQIVVCAPAKAAISIQANEEVDTDAVTR